MTVVPDIFFTEILPQIDDLNELRLTIYVFWRMGQMEGAFRYLREEDFLEDARWMETLGEDDESAAAALEAALRRAVERGTLLSASLTYHAGEETFYFLNSPKGRAAVQAIISGQWRPSDAAGPPPGTYLEHPNIFRLYEENIGPLTPLIADALGEAEDTYPEAWIREAFQIAVEYNKRSWRYIQAILERWQTERRDERKDRQDLEEIRRRYTGGEFSDFIEH